MQETEIRAQSPATLRYAEAEYFLSQFIKNCGPPIDSYFLMVCYFDAFLFVLVSVEEMVSKDAKTALQEKDVFRFLKALRNISSHHSVLAAALSDSKFSRPFSRVISASLGGPANDSSRLRLRFDILRSIFDSIEQEWWREKHTLDIARQYLAKLETQGRTEVYLEDVMREGLQEVKVVLAAKA